MATTRSPRILAVHAAIALAILTGMGCQGANTVMGLPNEGGGGGNGGGSGNQPPAVSNLTGTWEGSMRPKGCNGNFPVTAQITQTGNALSGTLTQRGCIETFGRLNFTGTYQNGLIDGTTTGDSPGSIHGEVTGTTLSLHAYSNGFDMGPITLHSDKWD